MKALACLILTAGLLLAADDAAPLARLKRKAEPDFFVLDRSGDGFLSRDEMPDDLRAELSKWDTNRDSFISLDEYAYFHSRRQQNRRDSAPPVSVIVRNEEELEGRPLVLRPGKLPEGSLPKWFVQFDMDDDGQVSLSEWHKGGHAIDSFRDWDRNDDGFITAEEALYKQRLIQIARDQAATKRGKRPPPRPAPRSTPPEAQVQPDTDPNLDIARDDRGGKAKKGDASKPKGRRS